MYYTHISSFISLCFFFHLDCFPSYFLPFCMCMHSVNVCTCEHLCLSVCVFVLCFLCAFVGVHFPWCSCGQGTTSGISPCLLLACLRQDLFLVAFYCINQTSWPISCRILLSLSPMSLEENWHYSTWLSVVWGIRTGSHVGVWSASPNESSPFHPTPPLKIFF